MSVLSNSANVDALQDSISELESKIYIIAETMKKLNKRIEKLENIAHQKGLLSKDDTETCIIS